jgi:hypothetical protein
MKNPSKKTTFNEHRLYQLYGFVFLGGGAQRHRLTLKEKLHPIIFFEREIFSGLYINILY